MKTIIQLIILTGWSIYIPHTHMYAMPMEPADVNQQEDSGMGMPTMPIETSDAPTEMGMPTAVSATMPTQPTQSLPTIDPIALSSAAPSPQTQNIPLATLPPQQQEIADIITKIKTIQTQIASSKKTLQDLIEKANTTIQDAQSTRFTMRTKAKSILEQQHEPAAQAALQEVAQLNQQITQLQTTMNTQIKESFAATMQQLQGYIEEGKRLTQELQDKGQTYHVEQLKIKEIHEKKAQELAHQKAVQEQGIMYQVAHFVAKSIKRIKKFFTGLVAIFSDTKTASKESASSKESGEKKTPSTPPSPTVTPHTTAIQNTLQQSDAAINTLDATHQELTQHFKELEKASYLFAPTDEEKKIPHDVVSETTQFPRWKQAALFIASEVLDAGEFILKSLIAGVKYLYQNTIAGIVNRFVGDVQQKIEEEESETKKDKEEHQTVQQPQEKPVTLN